MRQLVSIRTRVVDQGINSAEVAPDVVEGALDGIVVFDIDLDGKQFARRGRKGLDGSLDGLLGLVERSTAKQDAVCFV